MTELEAARVLLAGLDLLTEAMPNGTQTMLAASVCRDRVRGQIRYLEQDAPPWNPEPAPAEPRPWSEVSPGDEVQAPNGQWYRVDSWARIGGGVVAILNLPTGGTTKTTRNAGDTVPTRRGATGKAADIFRAGGLDVEQLGTEKAA